MDLTYYEINEFAKCMTDQVHDNWKFNAEIHGMKLKLPKIPKAPQKNVRQSDSKIDKLSEDLLKRMETQGSQYPLGGEKCGSKK